MIGTTRSSAVARERQNRFVWWAAYLLVGWCSVIIAMFARNRIQQPYLGLSLGILAALVTLWLMRPRLAMYVTLAVMLVGDLVTASWFPFTKNLSSYESIAYVSDGLSLSPLEISLATGLVVTTLRRFSRTGRLLPRNPMVRPLLLFWFLVLFGLVNGIASGGDVRIALMESRGMFYIPMAFLIAVEVLPEVEHQRNALIAALCGIVVHAIIAIEYFTRLPVAERIQIESLVEHGAALSMNLYLVVLVAAFVFRGVRPMARVLLVVGAIPIAVIYLVSQRRAAIAAIAIATIVIFAALYWRHRRRFWWTTPILLLFVTGYVAAFGNSDSVVGFPAATIKSVVLGTELTEKDISSDQYRFAENINLYYTIHASPITGLGFGHRFFRVVSLPTITDFDLAPYMPHNSFLWVWIKTGFVGFATTMYVIAKSVMLGMDRVRHAMTSTEAIVALTATSFIVMYSVYTFVDISWDVRNTPLLGFAIAVCSMRSTNAPVDEGTNDVNPARAEATSATPAVG